MSEITLQNTKAEIFAAYQAAQAAVLDLSEKLSDLNDMFKPSSAVQVTSETSLIPERVTVCIPYVKALAQGNELQLALRGWAENFKADMNIVVIGDREDWMSDLVHVIECERISTNPPLDVVNKIMLAIKSEEVTEKFIWANDDQYLISPCMLADFETLKYAGMLGETDFGSTLYQKNKARTAALLLKNNCSTLDFSTHTPVVFEKEKLLEIINKFDLTAEPHLVTTIYFNYWFPRFRPYASETPEALENDNLKVGVYRKGADLERLKKLMQYKKLVSNSESGWTPQLSEILNSYFSYTCRFEN